MSSERTEKEDKLIEKVQKKYPEFTDMVDPETSIPTLEAKLLTYAKHREDVLSHQANNAELTAAKEKVTELNGLYKPAIDEVKIKSAYLHILIKDLKESDGSQEG